MSAGPGHCSNTIPSLLEGSSTIQGELSFSGCPFLLEVQQHKPTNTRTNVTTHTHIPHLTKALRHLILVLSNLRTGTKAVFKADVRRQAARATQLVVSVIPALTLDQHPNGGGGSQPGASIGNGSSGIGNLPAALSSSLPPPLPPSRMSSSSKGDSSEALLLWVVKQLLLHRHPYLALEVRAL